MNSGDVFLIFRVDREKRNPYFLLQNYFHFKNSPKLFFSVCSFNKSLSSLVQSAETLEYTNWFSAEWPGYDTKQSDGEAPVLLELRWMQSTPSFTSFPGPLWHRVVAAEMILSMSQIELNCVLMLNWIVWNRSVFDI